MFSTKQSDIFFNDETNEYYVCEVSAVSAERCAPGEEKNVYGAVPIIYKIRKDTNYKQLIYPKNLDTFTTDNESDLFFITSKCASNSATKFDSISKPLISYNVKTERYSISFIGRYSTVDEGIAINNYVFQDLNTDFHLLDVQFYVPDDKQDMLIDANKYTFEDGFVNSDFYTGGNTIRNSTKAWYEELGLDYYERAPDYMIAPTYVQSNSSLGFNLILDHTTERPAITGNANFPFMYSGGYITTNPKYIAYDPTEPIRIDFTARSFNLTPTAPPTAYGGTQDFSGNILSNAASRWVQQFSPAGAGEGFCVFFYKLPEKDSYVIPNGVGSTLGYAAAKYEPIEIDGSIWSTVGLFEHSQWTPISGATTPEQMITGKKAGSFLGVGFDVAGNFGYSGSSDKSGWYDNRTGTQSPCSVVVRGNAFYDTPVLSAVDLASVPGATNIPLHTSAADADFVDYRIDLTNSGRNLTIYHKLTSDTDYNTIMELRLPRFYDSNSIAYDPWKGLRKADGTLPLLNIGLSYTTSNYVSQFELKSFSIKGRKVERPWERKQDQRAVQPSITDYINKSSDNLRKRMTSGSIEENVDIELRVPAKGKILNSLRQDNAEITLCDLPKEIENEPEVTVELTGVDPVTVDNIIQVLEKGDDPAPEIPTPNVKIIPAPEPEPEPEIEPEKPTAVFEQKNWRMYCVAFPGASAATNMIGIQMYYITTTVIDESGERTYVVVPYNKTALSNLRIGTRFWMEVPRQGDLIRDPGVIYEDPVNDPLDFRDNVDPILKPDGSFDGVLPFGAFDTGFVKHIYKQSQLDKFGEKFIDAIVPQKDRYFWYLKYDIPHSAKYWRRKFEDNHIFDIKGLDFEPIPNVNSLEQFKTAFPCGSTGTMDANLPDSDIIGIGKF